MSGSAPLLPTLQALLPPTLLGPVQTSLSLQALHSTQHVRTDVVYVNSQPVVPGQQRHLRLRVTPRSPGKGKANGNGTEKQRDNLGSRIIKVPGGGAAESEDTVENTGDGDHDAQETYSLSYVSMPLQGREYAGMDVRACLGVAVEGYSRRDEVDEFITLLGFRKSHTFTLSGHLFHLPVPIASSLPVTLDLFIARIVPPNSNPESEHHPQQQQHQSQQQQPHHQHQPHHPQQPDDSTSEPYLVQLQPSRPVPAVGAPGVIGLQDMMRVMHQVAARIDGVDWTGARA